MSKRAELPGPGIERAGAYRTADGKLHATRDEARRRNAEIGIEEFCGRYGFFSTEPKPADLCPYYVLGPDSLIKYADELFPLLKELLRKPASEATEPAG